MKNENKRLGLAAGALLGIASFLAAAPASAAAAPAVLMHAETKITSSGGVYPNLYVDGTTAGYVDVDGSVYAKSVTVYFSNNGGAWSTVAATYRAKLGGTREAWAFSIPNHATGYRATLSTTFAIKYEANGQVYWDNNGGQNYYATSGGYGSLAIIPMIESMLFVDSFQVSGQTFSGTIVVKNVSVFKTVKVRYTTDGWATWHDVDAVYSTTGSGYDLWSFSTTVPLNAKVKFAASYTVNGQTYWDSNFGANYGN